MPDDATFRLDTCTAIDTALKLDQHSLNCSLENFVIDKDKIHNFLQLTEMHDSSIISVLLIEKARDMIKRAPLSAVNRKDTIERLSRREL